MQLKLKSVLNPYLIPTSTLLAVLLSPLFGAAQDGQPTVPVFQDGEAQVVDGFKNPQDWIEHDLFVETEFDTDGDGKRDRMHVSVSRQKQTETEGLKVPVVYVTSPYFAGVSGTNKAYFWNPEHELNAQPPERKNPPPIKHQSRRPVISRSHLNEWIPRGYAVVHSCSPGTGLSQGCPTVGGQNESLAPKAVVDWLCGRAKGYTSLDGDEEVTADWCTGKVGMTGTSYNGTLPLACATTGVEGLEAIIPIAPNTSYYHYYRSHGLVRHPGGYMGEDIDVLYDFIHSGEPKNRDYCDCEVRDKEMANNMDRITGDYNEFWAGRDYLNQLDKLKAPVLMAHAFNDWNVMPEHSVRIYQALKEKGIPVQCYFHQGGHGGPPPMKQMNRWFTRYLHGVENGVEDDPKAWVVREKAKRTEPTPYGDYPNPQAKAVELFPNRPMPKAQGRGTLELQPIEYSGLDPSEGKPTFTDDVSITGADLAQSETSDHRLLFVTPELKEAIHISGTPSLSIKLASSKPAANLSVWVVSLPWKKRGRITENIITRGWADPQNHKSLTESEPLKPGQFYSLKFELQPDDQVIPAGQQIGLMIFSSDRDFTLWPKPGTELTVDLDATRLELPVVGGEKAMKKAFGQ
ncbi:MAG: Xaa-Pro dipeptidyl-peptidase [Mariniblastus sp.]|nr:Xaa-Pro dipeptidyl-peptidase [Mariniblastus sp.]